MGRREVDEIGCAVCEAVLAHSGEAVVSRLRFEHLTEYQRDRVIEFLKTWQVVPKFLATQSLQTRDGSLM